jgi:hypothetical protein
LAELTEAHCAMRASRAQLLVLKTCAAPRLEKIPMSLTLRLVKAHLAGGQGFQG